MNNTKIQLKFFCFFIRGHLIHMIGSDAPKTGESGNIFTLFALLVMPFVLTFGVLTFKKKNNG